MRYADQQVTTGSEAQAYASFIGGHMEGIADGKTYAEIDDRGAAQAVVDARESGASEAKIADLQATADELKAQRDSLFRGETLRGYCCRATPGRRSGGSPPSPPGSPSPAPPS